MLKSNITQKDIKIYELYLQRIREEGNLFWHRFKIYFSFNSGILIAIGFIAKPHLDNLPTPIPIHILIIIFFLSIVGVIFSKYWLAINKDGHKWQIFMNNIAVEVEKLLFEQKYLNFALYKKIMDDYYSTEKRTDVMDTNIHIAYTFFYMWILLGSFSVIAFLLQIKIWDIFIKIISK